MDQFLHPPLEHPQFVLGRLEFLLLVAFPQYLSQRPHQMLAGKPGQPGQGRRDQGASLEHLSDGAVRQFRRRIFLGRNGERIDGVRLDPPLPDFPGNFRGEVIPNCFLARRFPLFQ